MRKEVSLAASGRVGCFQQPQRHAIELIGNANLAPDLTETVARPVQFSDRDDELSSGGKRYGRARARSMLVNRLRRNQISS